MKSFFDSGPLPSWKELRSWLGKDIPWKLAENWDRAEDANWINDYVKQIMQSAKAGTSAPNRATVQTEARQEGKYVSVAIQLAPEVDIRALQLLATSERLKIAGLPGGKSRIVRLPGLVYPRSGKAVMKKGRQIVVRFKRRPPEKSEYELFIQT
ncbi:hypothetical protein [Cohnella hongkongensis]|uniref:Chaperone DnaJ C-terminal domain-containing protein n=1 Tax=Cohnella hongkongensis TaxID=178337 RepID=A0ABV9FEK5_9BACL